MARTVQQATAEVFLTVFKALPRRKQEDMLERRARDRRLRRLLEDLSDRVAIEEELVLHSQVNARPNPVALPPSCARCSFSRSRLFTRVLQAGLHFSPDAVATLRHLAGESREPPRLAGDRVSLEHTAGPRGASISGSSAYRCR
jgi:hypothetical protein